MSGGKEKETPLSPTASQPPLPQLPQQRKSLSSSSSTSVLSVQLHASASTSRGTFRGDPKRPIDASIDEPKPAPAVAAAPSAEQEEDRKGASFGLRSMLDRLLHRPAGKSKDGASSSSGSGVLGPSAAAAAPIASLSAKDPMARVGGSMRKSASTNFSNRTRVPRADDLKGEAKAGDKAETTSTDSTPLSSPPEKVGKLVRPEKEIVEAPSVLRLREMSQTSGHGSDGDLSFFYPSDAHPSHFAHMPLTYAVPKLLLAYLEHYETRHPNNSSTESIFNGLDCSTLDRFIYKLLTNKIVPEECIILGTGLLARAHAKNAVHLSSQSVRKLFAVCVTVATKTLLDAHKLYTNPTFAFYAKVPSADFNNLELAFLLAMDFDAVIAPTAFHKCAKCLTRHILSESWNSETALFAFMDALKACML
eukprot:TRINITY_DN8263_c0_g1_i1.p1 TRINITY_DN8263_c0_g1~~TRINITY_DN8263_c0_g1_i1.p1  ORF type:complete len:443 (-),score=89.85 TRINITY_DN8263_c0_g1_i1:142-1401(-)